MTVGGTAIHSCSIIVGESNDMVSQIHDRMPVILAPESFSTWLDVHADVTSLKGMLRPLQSSRMFAYKVSARLNNPRNDDSSFARPLDS